MSRFYVSIIFLGVMLVIVSIMMIAYDRKRSLDYFSEIDAKKEELVGIMSDAEQMVEELNKFSDYIVTQMDVKNEELNTSFKNIEEHIELFNSKIPRSLKSKAFTFERVANGGFSDIGEESFDNEADMSANLILNDIVINEDNPSHQKVVNSQLKIKLKDISCEKVIPLNSKFKEVVRLSQQGIDDTTIAKRMNMGKGEVQLIIETCKQI